MQIVKKYVPMEFVDQMRISLKREDVDLSSYSDGQIKKMLDKVHSALTIGFNKEIANEFEDVEWAVTAYVLQSMQKALGIEFMEDNKLNG